MHLSVLSLTLYYSLVHWCIITTTGTYLIIWFQPIYSGGGESVVSSSPVFMLADMLAWGGGRASLGGIKRACPAPLISPNQHMLIGGGVPYGHPCQTTPSSAADSMGERRMVRKVSE